MIEKLRIKLVSVMGGLLSITGRPFELRTAPIARKGKRSLSPPHKYALTAPHRIRAAACSRTRASWIVGHCRTDIFTLETSMQHADSIRPGCRATEPESTIICMKSAVLFFYSFTNPTVFTITFCAQSAKPRASWPKCSPRMCAPSSRSA